MSAHPLNEDLRIVPDDEWMYGQQNYEAALAANLARREDEAKATMRRVEAYIAANKANEIAENFSRIREEGRAADRQDDLEDMVRYWDQLKKDEVTSSTLDNQVKSPLRIMEEQRAEDRRDDLRDMVQYWNQLK